MTLAFAGIGAATGLLTFGNEISKRLAERQAVRTAEAARWSITAKTTRIEREFEIEIRYADPSTHPVMLAGLNVMDPDGSEIAFPKPIYTASGGLSHYEPSDRGWSNHISPNVNLSASQEHRGSAIMQLVESRSMFLVRIQATKKTNIGSTFRIRVRVTAEERSSTRRQKSMDVISQPLTWTASNADKAT